MTGHYNTGSCKGFQFLKEQDEEKIKKLLEDNLKIYLSPPKSVQPYQSFQRRPPKPKKCQCLLGILKEIGIILVIILFLPFAFMFYNASERYYIYNNMACILYCLSFIPVFIAYEIFFIPLDRLILLPGLFYWPYYERLKEYLNNENDE